MSLEHLRPPSGGRAPFSNLLCAVAPEAMFALTAVVSAGNLRSGYEEIPPIDFSRDVLNSQPERLLLVMDSVSAWTDLGSPARVFETISRGRLNPEWPGRAQ